MRSESLVLPADVLKVKRIEGGDGRHRILVFTAKDVPWPDEKSVKVLRTELASRIPGVKRIDFIKQISMPMKFCRSLDTNVWLTIDLGVIPEHKARWYKSEVERIVSDKRRFTAAKSASPHKGKSPIYENRRVAIATATA